MALKKINKVLIANRGEIAKRIIRACHKLGLRTVQPLSEADKDLSFAKFADESYVIGEASAKDSYLNIVKLINIAKETKCDAVHPGYGFLSENAEFAKAVEDAGLIFIGPSYQAIDLLGDKTKAREVLSKNGVPITQGAKAGLDDNQLVSEAEKIGFPVIVKAVAGGGGRGMRIVRNSNEMREALPRIRSEAEKFFSNPDVYFEQYIENPRHVEVQIFGDSHGNVVHFGTRECSLQRRHQKIIEEAPAIFLKLETLEAIHEAAVQAGKTVNYKNAGTAEFLVKDDKFYFLEINTRIQVEHPATEEITGTDLVELQIRIADGEKIPFKQSDIKFSGHAMEFRIYAEDPENNFAPARGLISEITVPKIEGLREEWGFEKGDTVSLHYDALLTKLIVKAKDRKTVIARSRELFNKFEIKGLKTSIDFHRWALLQPEFVLNYHDIGYLDRTFNKEKLKEIFYSKEKDPVHEANKVEEVEIGNMKINITHIPDGLFLGKTNNKKLLSYSRDLLIKELSKS